MPLGALHRTCQRGRTIGTSRTALAGSSPGRIALAQDDHRHLRDWPADLRTVCCTYAMFLLQSSTTR